MARREPTIDELFERIQLGLENRGPGSDPGPFIGPTWVSAPDQGVVGEVYTDYDMRVLLDWAFDPFLRMVND